MRVVGTVFVLVLLPSGEEASVRRTATLLIHPDPGRAGTRFALLTGLVGVRYGGLALLSGGNRGGGGNPGGRHHHFVRDLSGLPADRPRRLDPAAA